MVYQPACSTPLRDCFLLVKKCAVTQTKEAMPSLPHNVMFLALPLIMKTFVKIFVFFPTSLSWCKLYRITIMQQLVRTFLITVCYVGGGYFVMQCYWMVLRGLAAGLCLDQMVLFLLFCIFLSLASSLMSAWRILRWFLKLMETS
jgi:hypothetical protein